MPNATSLFTLADITASNDAVRAQMDEFQRATADRLLELAAHLDCAASAVVAPTRKGGPFTFLALRAGAPSSAVVDINRYGGTKVRAPKSGTPAATELARTLALAVTHYWPEPTGRMVACDGEAHSNAFIDHCMTCLPWGWGKVPEYKPFDLDEARAQLRDVRRSSLPCDEGPLVDRIDALLASGELVEMSARWAGKGHVTGGYVLRWNLKKVATKG